MCAEPVTIPPRPGFFGKLPAHGDFVDRGLPRAFIDPWDEWLQAALANSRELLGGAWLSHYMVGPIWRFALAGGLCGQCAWRGLLMPSVDRVNRYFPLTVAIAEPAQASPLAALAGNGDWFDACEEAALSALDPTVDADTLAQRLADIETRATASARVSCPRYGAEGASAWHFGLPDSTGADLAGIVAEALLRQDYPQVSLWWTTGSEAISPSLLIHRGMPSIHDFAALLDGQWRHWGWADCPVNAAEATPGPLPDPGEPVS
jgi:type VI secretion system protein ImpM